MMKTFKPMTKCTVMMMGSDGKMYSMTTTDAKCTSMGRCSQPRMLAAEGSASHW